MKALLRLIPSLATDEIDVRFRTVKRRAIFISLVVICGLVAIGFGFAALAIWLTSLYGALNACLIIAVGFLALAVIILVVMKILDARARRIARRRREANRALYLAAAMAAAPSGLRSRSIIAIAIPLAALAGFLLSGKAAGFDDKD